MTDEESKKNKESNHILAMNVKRLLNDIKTIYKSP